MFLESRTRHDAQSTSRHSARTVIRQAFSFSGRAETFARAWTCRPRGRRCTNACSDVLQMGRYSRSTSATNRAKGGGLPPAAYRARSAGCPERGSSGARRAHRSNHSCKRHEINPCVRLHRRRSGHGCRATQTNLSKSRGRDSRSGEHVLRSANPRTGVRDQPGLVRSTVAGEGNSCLATDATGIHQSRRPEQVSGGEKLNFERPDATRVSAARRACRSVHSKAVPNRSCIDR